MTMEDASVLRIGDECIDLPPGFRFHPSDEEIITHYLTPKVMDNNFRARAIGEADFNKCEPWDLPSKAKMGEKEWYFFCQRDRKYPTGMRTNRATESGYWKATGKDKEIYKGKACLVGMKKTLVFYKGRAPKGEKSNWVMHEYRLEGKFSYYNLSKSAKDEWVVSRVFHKSTGLKKSPISGLVRISSYGEDLSDYFSLPPLWDPPYFNNDCNQEDFKGAAPSTPSAAADAIQASSFSNAIENEPDNKIFLPSNSNINNYQGNLYNPSPNSAVSASILQSSLPNSFWPFPRSANSDYLHQIRNNNTVPNLISSGLIATQEASSSKMQCKVEQFSNHSMVSQDTGLTTDVNPEISSHHSTKEMNNNGCYDDLECLLNY